MNQKVFKRRIYITAVFLIAISVLFIIRLFSLHFSDRIIVNDSAKADVRRGAIRDRNGYILAMTIESYSLYANPEKVKDPVKTARALSKLTGLDGEFLYKRLTRECRFIWLRRKMDVDSMEAIRRLDLPGISFKKEYRRVYPHNSLASNITGFVGIDNTGLEGIEYQYNAVLSARYGEGGSGSPADTVYGKNIVLTLDRYIQDRAEREIRESVSSSGAKQGAVVVMDVKSGRLLAVAKYPTYNPNRYYAWPEFNLRNFSVIDSFEPGSTMKVLSLAAAYEYDPSLFRKVYTCRGSIDIGDTTINCDRAHGRVNIRDIVSHSCNVGVIETMKSVPKEHFYNFIRRFGFGNRTETGLPGESPGILRAPDQWSGLSKYSMSIGYELSVTSLQLVAAYSAIANGGIYNSPMIIERIEDEDGAVVQDFFPVSRGRVCAEKTARLMMELMKGTVAEGTGTRASLQYYTVGGKTGTSKKFSRVRGLYSDMAMSSFVGIAPIEKPEICMLVVIDSPAGGESGGRVAAQPSLVSPPGCFHIWVLKTLLSKEQIPSGGRMKRLNLTVKQCLISGVRGFLKA